MLWPKSNPGAGKGEAGNEAGKGNITDFRGLCVAGRDREAYTQAPDGRPSAAPTPQARGDDPAAHRFGFLPVVHR